MHTPPIPSYCDSILSAHRTREATEADIIAAWKFLLLLPRLLLHKTQQGRECGERGWNKRIALFDHGQWSILQEMPKQYSKTNGPRRAENETAKFEKILRLAQDGEVSHAPRALLPPGLAPSGSNTK